MIKVALVEDEEIVREGLKSLLSRMDDLDVVGVFERAETVLNEPRLADPAACDVLLVDLDLPGMSGLDLIAALARRAPHLATLALTNNAEPGMVSAVLRAGARGYLGKNLPVDSLRDGVRAAKRGLLVTSIAQVRTVLRQLGDVDPKNELNPVDSRLLGLVAEGLTNAEIAARTHYAESTVKHMVSALMRRFGVGNRVQLARIAWDNPGARERETEEGSPAR